MSNSVRSRNPKINSKQKKILLQFLADNPPVYFCKITTAFTHEDHHLFWKRAAIVLNEFGPPIKTPQIWKKAWKDMRLRYRKARIDTKQILFSLKSEKIFNSIEVLEKAEKLASVKGAEKVQLLERIGMNVSYLDDDNEDISKFVSRSPRRKPNAEEIKIDILKTKEVAAELGLASLEKKLQEEIKSNNEEMADNHLEELFLDVDDLSKSEDDFPNDSVHCFDNPVNEVICTNETLQKDGNYASPKVVSVSSAHQCNDDGNVSKTNLSNKILESILNELRRQNSIQKENLEVQKNFVSHQKWTMQQMLKVQTEMAKAQTALANTVKSFVNNISFNL